MNVLIRRIDTALPLPQYQSIGAVAFDVYSRLDVTVPPQQLARIPTNLIIQVPVGYVLYLKDRSSTASKGLLATAGIIDQDFCGDHDEILFQVYNFTTQPVFVKRAERIAQGIFLRMAKADWQENSESLQHYNRGGFGSTGSS